MNIIVIEDEKIKRTTMHDALKKAGYNVESFASPLFALNYFDENGADIVITDIRMPDIDGFEVLKRVKEQNPETSVVMMTAYGTIQSAVDAMKRGAYDYITKPFSSEHLLIVVKKLERIKELEHENLNLKKQLKERYSFHKIIGKSKVMQELYDQIETVASSDMSILIEGESGTGKELVANAIHSNSPRNDKPFVKLSCAVLNESILESELFGHEKGAFTGAHKDKKGRFELANHGTLFLDDVDDIPMSFQVKLLRVLQEKEFEKVGGSESIKVNVRVICATKVDLWEKVKKNEFREDLYYRLRVIPIKLPPLRERQEDIPLLVDHFLKKISKDEVRFTPEALDELACKDWPGNIRQLENAVYRIAALSKSGEITNDQLPDDLVCSRKNPTNFSFNGESNSEIDLHKMVDDLEKEAVEWAMKKAGGNQSKAAELLKLKRTTLRDKLNKYRSTNY
jgi:DNA-binding NtrC family response regulator